MTQAQIFLHTCTNYFCLIVGRSVGYLLLNAFLFFVQSTPEHQNHFTTL